MLMLYRAGELLNRSAADAEHILEGEGSQNQPGQSSLVQVCCLSTFLSISIHHNLEKNITFQLSVQLKILDKPPTKRSYTQPFPEKNDLKNTCVTNTCVKLAFCSVRQLRLQRGASRFEIQNSRPKDMIE